MGLWGEIKQRRITQVVLAYLAGGWMVLAVVDQVVDREVLPTVVYQVTLVLYLFGIAFALILGWYHGEKGNQKATAVEIIILSVIGIIGLGTSAMIIRGHFRASAVATALETSTMDLRRVAVLYFQDETLDGSLAAVADGLTNGLIRSLNEVRELDVVSRNGAERVRGLDATPDSIASIFNAGTLIDGSVGQDGESLRVTVRLIDGQSGTQIQRDEYTWPTEDLASVEGQLAQEVSRSLRVLLGEEIRLREGRSNAPSTAAWLLVARAEKALMDGTSALSRGEDDVAEQAFALADQELARAQEMQEEWVEPVVLRGRVAYEGFALATTLDDLAATIERAIELADQALQMEPDEAAALELRGTARYRLWLLQLDDDEDALDRLLEAAQADLERSLSLDRARANVNSVLSHLYYQVGDWPQAVLAARQAYQEDAYLASADGVLQRLYLASYDLGEYEEALRWCLEGATRFPDDYRFVECQLYVLTMPRAEPDVARAWELYEDFVALLPEAESELFSGLAQTFLGGVIGRAGLPDSANAVLMRARLSPEADPGYEQLSMEAAMRAIIGDVDGSVEALQRFMIRNPGHFPGQHWWWQNLEGDPAFERLKSMY